MEVDSRIEQVTVYARGAQVRRTANVALSGTRTRARLVGLTLGVIDDTVRVEVEGGALATSVRVGLAALAAPAAAHDATPELRWCRERRAVADAEVKRLEAALGVLTASPVAVAVAQDAPPTWSSVLEARRALVALRAERELVLREQLSAARRERELAIDALTAAQDRDQRAGNARQARVHEMRKYVEIELEASASGAAVIAVEYQVAAARWAPSYVARLDGELAVLELRAVIAQASGEDWSAVKVRLSTAEPARFAALPELAAQRIGRRQAEPPRPGFRAPPTGTGALFADYLDAFPIASAPETLQNEVWDEESSGAKPAFDDVPTGAVPAPPKTQSFFAQSAPMVIGGMGPPQGIPPARAALVNIVQAAPEAKKRAQTSDGMARSMMYDLGGGAPGAASKPAPPPPPAPRLDYAKLRMSPIDAPTRGALIPHEPDPREAAIASGVAAFIARLDALALPPGCFATWAHTYDYAFATDGAVDVRSDGSWHSIAVTSHTTTAQLHHVAVPRQQPDAFRLARIINPFAGPLLPGPIDVYDRGRFLVTSSVGHTPPSATVEVGLGVDPEIKVARNTEFREETTGVLRGGLRLHHAVAIDIDNASDREIELEVRERIPVTREDDDDIEVVLGRVEPPWDRWAPEPAHPEAERLRGGHRWRVVLPAGGKRTLRAAYEIKLANKLELVGGNRRDA